LKARGRAIPSMWRQKYQTLFDKLEADDGDDEGPTGSTIAPVSDPAGSAMEIASDPETVDSSDSSHDRAKLFSSDNPALQTLLQPLRRVYGKSQRPEFPKPAGTKAKKMDIDDIERVAGNETAELLPKDWAKLNKGLKAVSMKAPKNSTQDDGKKSADTPGRIAFTTFLKREHSKVYHKTCVNHVKAGLDVSIAKKLATAAARAKASELKALRASGHFEQYV